MFQILLLWLVQFLVLFGHGEIFARLVLRRWWPGDSWLNTTLVRFWIGTAVVFTFLEFWYLFLPINGTCWKIVVVLGAVGCVLRFAGKRDAAAAPLKESRRDGWGRGLAVTICLLQGLLAAWSVSSYSAQELPWDTNMYHLTLVRWMNEYPAVPGLANLQLRFGNNTGFLRYAALWNTGAFTGRASWLVSCFFELVVFLEWMLVLFQSRAPLALRSFCLLTLPFFLFTFSVGSVSSMSFSPTASASLFYDSFPQIVILLLVAQALRAWGKGEAAAAPQAPRFFLMLCLAALAFVGKPSGAVTLFLVTMACAAVFFWQRKRGGGIQFRTAVQCMALPSLMVAGYMAVGVILSGWPLYPLTVAKFPCDWAVPPEDAKHLYDMIKGFARIPGPAMFESLGNFWRWFPSWGVEQFWPSMERRLVLVSLFALPAYLYCVLGRPWDRRRSLELTLLGLAATNLLFWFINAPSLRFGSAFFWCFYALVVGLLLERFFGKRKLVLSLGFLFSVYWCVDLKWMPNRIPSVWALPQAEPANTRKVTIPNGQTPPLVVRVPKGISAKSCAIGDSPLPAAPELPSLLLHWRVPGSLRSGFKIAPSPPSLPTETPEPEDSAKVKP